MKIFRQSPDKINICPICVAVSSLCLGLSAGVAWGYLDSSIYLIPISLLMGGTVVGIAYLGEKKCRWAAKHQLLWKTIIIAGGMPFAYLLVIKLNRFIVLAELLILIKIAYLFFIKQPRRNVGTSGSNNLSTQAGISEIEEKMEQCC
ncbi:MAG TPA: hypothetical protein VJH71_00725 [Candidatus Paceibacterota bacterium]